jgi:hypothetical protein
VHRITGVAPADGAGTDETQAADLDEGAQ